MTIDLNVAGADVLAYYKNSVEAMSDSELISGSRKMPDLMRGLKQDKPNVEQLRERVLAKLQLKTIPPPVLEILRSATLADGLIVVLSERALNLGLVALIERFGRVPIIASMLLDDRETVRESAKVEFAKPLKSNIKVKDGEAFKQRFKPLIDVMRPVVQDVPYEPPSSRSQAVVVTTLAPTREQMERDIQSSTLYKQLLRERNQFESQCKSLEVVEKKLKLQIEKNNSLIKEMNFSIQKYQVENQQKIAEGIADAINKRISTWLTPSEIMIGPATKSVSVLDRARQVLLQQAKFDKRFGTRVSISEELQTARELQASLKSALFESIRPLPNLAVEISALADHIHILEKLLTESSIKPAEPQLVQLNEELQVINEMTSLIKKKKSVEQSMIVDAWSSDLCRQAYEILDRRAMLIYMLANSASYESKNELPAASPAQHFELCIRTAKSCRLMIDGHNLLPKVKQLIGKEFFTSGQGPNALGRALLIEKVRQLTSLHPLISADIWFDGPDDQHWTESSNLRVWFSGGKGSDRADGRILENLQAQSYIANSKLCFVVTEDRDLLIKSINLGAHGLSPLEFWIRVS